MLSKKSLTGWKAADDFWPIAYRQTTKVTQDMVFRNFETSEKSNFLLRSEEVTTPKLMKNGIIYCTLRPKCKKPFFGNSMVRVTNVLQRYDSRTVIQKRPNSIR